MQVAHNDDLDTHAVIGGAKPMAFGIAQTAEFFTILSSTLYSNKALAVIREVLCNAWDSHIASGVTDIPVKITIDQDKIIIRDFGKGIAPDMMHPIYCVYGASTKKNDGNQTGGFGLGSKAPFAYSDFFTVTSFYNGKKNVYAISRGSALTEGKPDMRVVVGNLDTTEQGLEVNIPIKAPEDVSKFQNIIKNIAKYGEMNVTLNGDHLPILPISTSAFKSAFICKQIPEYLSHNIFIRYGNVIYPITHHLEYAHELKLLEIFLNRLSPNNYSNSDRYNLIIQALPNTISVTPSRESLSMTETTINTLKELFKVIAKEFTASDTKIADYKRKLEQSAIDEQWLRCTPQRILYKDRLYNTTKTPPTYFSSMQQIAEYLMSRTISDDERKIFRKMHLESLIKGNYFRKHMLIKIMKLFKRGYNTDPYEYSVNAYQPFHKVFTRPLLTNLVKAGFSTRNLFFVHPDHSRKAISGYRFSDPLKFKAHNDAIYELMNGTITLIPNRQAYTGYHNNRWQTSYADIVYVSPKDKHAREKVKLFFEKQGFYVIDYHTQWDEEQAIKAPIVKGPPEPKVVGIPSLLMQIAENGNFNPRGYRNLTDRKDFLRVEKPELIFQAYALNSNYNARFFEFGDNFGNDIVKIWGKRSGVVANIVQYEKYISMGAKNGTFTVIQEICDYVLNNKNIIAHKTFSMSEDYIARTLTNIAEFSSLIKTKLNLPNPLTDEEVVYERLFNRFAGSLNHYSKYEPTSWQGVLRAASDKFNALTASKESIELTMLIEKRKTYLNMINVHDIYNTLFKSATSKSTPAEKLAMRTHCEILLIRALDL